MRYLREKLSLLRGLRNQKETDQRLAEEMSFHLDMAAERHRRAGVPDDEARRRAALDFGGRDRFAEEARDETRSRVAEETGRDVRTALRTLRRSPGFAATVILTLALGVGATTVVYSVIDNVVLRPLAYADPGRLVVVREHIPALANTYPSLPANAGHYVEMRRRCRACAGVAALTAVGMTLSGDGDPERLRVVRASASLFPLLGARAQLGRLFTEQDDRPGERVVVLGHGLWRRRFGGDPGVVGRSVTLRDEPYEVIGVLPEDFRLPKGDEMGALVRMPREVDAYVPLALTPRQISSPGSYDYSVLARLAPNATVEGLRRELDQLEVELDPSRPNRAVVTPLRESVLGDASGALLLLLAAVGAVLLVVCVNLATLLLARTTARARELAVRVALGAGRQRLVRHALTEGVVLALLGGALGVLLAWLGLGALLRAAPADLPRLEEVRLDGRVLLVMLTASVAVGLGFGALPAIRAGRADPNDALRSGGRTSSARGRGRAALIASQVALSTVLLVVTGLLLASFVRVLGVDRGFEADRVLALDVVPPPARYGTREAEVGLYDRLVAELRAVPGVARVAVGGALPLEGETQVYTISAFDAPPGTEPRAVNVRFVSPDYFAALGMPLVRGRPFTERGREDDAVVITARAARTLWPGQDPIGRRVKVFDEGQPLRVVGVAADVPTTSLEREGSLIAYAPYWIADFGRATFVLRTAGEPGAVAAAARAAVRRVDPAVPVPRTRTMSEVVSQSLAKRRFQLVVLALFAATALVTACVGIYGVVAHSVAQRSGEMAVRLALGARPADVRRLVLGEGMRPVAAGLLVGVGVALASRSLLGALLFGVQAADPTVIGAVAAVLAAVAALACWAPARRAARTGPGAALRLG